MKISCLLITILLMVSSLQTQTLTDLIDDPVLQQKRPILKKSHVAAWFDDMDDYKKYDVDVIIQDMDIVSEQELDKWKIYIKQLHDDGKIFFAELRPLTHLGNVFESIMTDPGMQEAVCVDFNFNPVRTPWMADRAYKTIPVYLYCSNNPRYRAWIRHQVYMFMEAGADGIMVDDLGGSPFSFDYGGCFCDYSMAGFREYLKKKYSVKELKKSGIDDIDHFNYRKMVLKYADDRKSYSLAQRKGEIPFNEDFQDFLFESDAKLFKSLKDMAGRLKGKYVLMGWNNVNFIGRRAVYYDFVDAFYFEITYQRFGLYKFGKEQREFSRTQKEDEYLPPSIIYTYKLADALHKWYAPTPEPWSWGVIKEKNLTGLLRQWIAFSYANGAVLRYPRKGWCFGPTSRWYYPQKEDYEPLYDFIRKHAELFDHYEAVAQIGVLYTHHPSIANNPYFKPLKYVCGELVNLNIPFGLAVAGDKWLSSRISEEDINHFELMLLPEPFKLDEKQKHIVESWQNKNKVISITENDNVARKLKGKIKPLQSVESKSKVWLFPRRVPGQERAPIVLHIVNSEYDSRTNKMIVQKNIKVRLSKKLINNSQVTKITYYTIAKEPFEPQYKIKRDDIHITIPELELWGILKIEIE